MQSMERCNSTAWTAVALAALALSGCTSVKDYFRQGCKVGPSYTPAAACMAPHWIDANDQRVASGPADTARWWNVFNDSTLNQLIAQAYQQNLTLREAGFRILEARAQLGIAAGNLFPQTQDLAGGYKRGASSVATSGFIPPNRFSDQWNLGFNLAWELDFWGRFRRAVVAQEAQLEASVNGYDQVLVTLLGDIATNYVQVRTDQERIRLLKANVDVQQGVLTFIENRFAAGFHQMKLDVDQARSNLDQTRAAIPQLEIDMRTAANRLCVLMGTPPADLACLLAEGPIPTAPAEVAVGIPCDLVRRRPDVRQAERLAAAQAEQIGIAQADFYPAISISGTLGYQAQNFSQLFTNNAFNGSIGPSFQWNILNYGRILNNVRYQDARFKELIVTYQQTALQANEEAEDGLVTFLRAQERAKLLDESVRSAQSAVEIVLEQLKTGSVDFNRYAVIDQNLVQQQDLSAQARGQIAQGLVQVYRALGGGWQIRCTGPASTEALPLSTVKQPTPALEALPTPPPVASDAKPAPAAAPQPPIAPLPPQK